MKQGRAPAAEDIRLEKPSADALAGFLSYLVPGLGQVYQGRIAKGVLFLVCLYVLFFYGLYLGSWQNVYIYTPPPQPNPLAPVPTTWSVITDRARFIAQFFIGVAAWPAIWQFTTYDPTPGAVHPVLGRFQRMPSEEEQNEMLRNSDKSPDLGWVYTIIAGALNILVIYDAYAGPVFPGRPRSAREEEQLEARS
jgi:hypothetical protein